MSNRTWVAVLLVAGCQDNVSTPFPPGLEPFSDGDEPAELTELRDEVLQTRTTDDGAIDVYGRGFVLAPPATVWAAALLPEVMIAVCKTDAQTVTLGIEPAYELSFLVHYVVNDILTVEWDDQWRGAIVPAAEDHPRLGMIIHQKVQGSDFITLSDGSIQIRDTDDPALTELWFVEHLDAISAGAGEVVQGMQDNYDRLVAVAHGFAVPPCR